MMERTRRYITMNEGLRYRVYLDHLGNRTIGVGFNLERPDAEEKIAALGLDFAAVLDGRISLLKAHIDSLLDGDILAAMGAARRAIPDFNQLATDRAIVIVDMIFNLGEAGFNKFKNMIQAVNHQDWDRAAREIQNSRYASQVPNRAGRNIQAMRRGSLPNMPPLDDGAPIPENPA
jgi:GH24 family phage-related lysozyme (muramidase)